MTPYRLSVHHSSDERSLPGRRVEEEVFYETFKNTPELLRREYGPYESQSVFLTVHDTLKDRAVGTVRLIVAGPSGFKSLNDLERAPWNKSLKETLERTGLELEESSTVDGATLAVQAEYRGAASGGVVSLALYQGIVQLMKRSGRRYFVAVMDLKAWSSIQKGLKEPFTGYRGVGPARYLDSASSLPCWIDIDAWEIQLGARDPEVHAIIFDGKGLESVLTSPDWDEAVAELEVR